MRPTARALELGSAATQRLGQYIERLGTLLGYWEKGNARASSPSLHACGDPEQARHMHDKQLHFVGGSHWSDAAVRLEAARYACQAMTEKEPVTTWVVDDTGFLEQGTHSVGVQRQYTGSAGKVTNCQIGVSLETATATQHAPIDFELYLPESCLADPERRAKARIPEEVTFKTKAELVLGTRLGEYHRASTSANASRARGREGNARGAILFLPGEDDP